MYSIISEYRVKVKNPHPITDKTKSGDIIFDDEHLD